MEIKIAIQKELRKKDDKKIIITDKELNTAFTVDILCGNSKSATA